MDRGLLVMIQSLEGTETEREKELHKITKLGFVHIYRSDSCVNTCSSGVDTLGFKRFRGFNFGS